MSRSGGTIVLASYLRPAATVFIDAYYAYAVDHLHADQPGFRHVRRHICVDAHVFINLAEHRAERLRAVQSEAGALRQRAGLVEPDVFTDPDSLVGRQVLIEAAVYAERPSLQADIFNGRQHILGVGDGGRGYHLNPALSGWAPGHRQFFALALIGIEHFIHHLLGKGQDIVVLRPLYHVVAHQLGGDHIHQPHRAVDYHGIGRQRDVRYESVSRDLNRAVNERVGATKGFAEYQIAALLGESVPEAPFIELGGVNHREALRVTAGGCGYEDGVAVALVYVIDRRIERIDGSRADLSIQCYC